MCMIPYSGMDAALFSELCSLEDFDAVNSLLSPNWRMLDEHTDMLSLYAVIYDVIRNQLNPTPASCKDFVIRLWQWFVNFWYHTHDEQQLRAPYIFFLLTHYPEPVPGLSTQYADFINMAWMCGNFPLSIESGHK